MEEETIEFGEIEVPILPVEDFIDDIVDRPKAIISIDTCVLQRLSKEIDEWRENITRLEIVLSFEENLFISPMQIQREVSRINNLKDNVFEYFEDSFEKVKTSFRNIMDIEKTDDSTIHQKFNSPKLNGLEIYSDNIKYEISTIIDDLFYRFKVLYENKDCVHKAWGRVHDEKLPNALTGSNKQQMKDSVIFETLLDLQEKVNKRYNTPLTQGEKPVLVYLITFDQDLLKLNGETNNSTFGNLQIIGSFSSLYKKLYPASTPTINS